MGDKKKLAIPVICLIFGIMLFQCTGPSESADPSFSSVMRNTGSAEITVEPYTESYASKHPVPASKICGYDARGKLVEEQQNVLMSDIALTLAATNNISDSTLYTVSENGAKTKQSSWEYSYEDGHVSKKTVRLYSDDDNDGPGKWYTVRYSYTGSGELSAETTSVTSSSGSDKTKSVVTYFYNDDQSCSGYTTFNVQDNILQRTEYVNNTNGKPVREKTYSSDGTCIRTVVNAYNTDGTISRQEIKDQSGETQSRTEYFYDRDGYLMKSLVYNNDDGTLKPYRSYLYTVDKKS